jgi:hypothetical protein
MDNFIKNICILNFGLTLYLSYRLCKIENKFNKSIKNKIKHKSNVKLKKNKVNQDIKDKNIIKDVLNDVLDKVEDIEECNKVNCKNKANCDNNFECNKHNDLKNYEKLDSVILSNKINNISSTPELLENPISPSRDSIIRRHSDELCETLFDFTKYFSWKNKFKFN